MKMFTSKPFQQKGHKPCRPRPKCFIFSLQVTSFEIHRWGVKVGNPKLTRLQWKVPPKKKTNKPPKNTWFLKSNMFQIHMSYPTDIFNNTRFKQTNPSKTKTPFWEFEISIKTPRPLVDPSKIVWNLKSLPGLISIQHAVVTIQQGRFVAEELEVEGGLVEGWWVQGRVGS